MFISLRYSDDVISLRPVIMSISLRHSDNIHFTTPQLNLFTRIATGRTYFMDAPLLVLQLVQQTVLFSIHNTIWKRTDAIYNLHSRPINKYL